MGFRLVPKSVTLNGVTTVILRFSPNSVALGADYVKVVEDRPYSLRRKCSPNNLVFSDVSFTAISVVTENERIIYRHLRDIHPLLDYDTSESQSMISI